MKKRTLLTLGAALAFSGCANDPASHGKSEIFGKVNIINEHGKDMTESCSTNINKKGVLQQKAIPGSNMLKLIICTPGTYMYTIKPAADVTVDVPADGVAVYFGDVTITLDDNGYTIKHNGHNSAGLYDGTLPVKQGELKVGSAEKDWAKNFMGGTGGMPF